MEGKKKHYVIILIIIIIIIIIENIIIYIYMKLSDNDYSNVTNNVHLFNSIQFNA